jgi:endonuclease/exonuclease/phosphatase family metal-dependent hydrolase
MCRLFFLLVSAILLSFAARATAVPLELQFVSYNIRYENHQDQGWRAWPTRLQRLVTTIRTMDPDVIGVQEALHAQVADLCLSLPDYEFYGFGRDDGKTKGEYAGVFYKKSRFQADGSDAGMFWLSATPEKPGSMTWGNKIPRVVTWLHLRDRQTQRGFTVYNSHWDHMHQGSRVESAKLIAQRIDARKHRDDPLVLLGDFNATEGNNAVDFLAGRTKAWANSLLDPYHQLYPKVSSRRTLHFWRNNKDGWAKVDHILVSPPVQMKKAAIVYAPDGGTPASDHYPVSARIVWP